MISGMMRGGAGRRTNGRAIEFGVRSVRRFAGVTVDRRSSSIKAIT